MSINPALFEGFSKLSQEARFERLMAMGVLTLDDIAFIKSGGIQSLQLAETLVENAIGYFQLPLGVATNFCIDGEDYVIPLAVEETSIIAALSKTAKWIRQNGHIETAVFGETLIGQIQLAKVDDFERFSAIIAENTPFLIEDVNKVVAHTMVLRGGGVKSLTLRALPRPDGATMAIIHVHMDCCDAMGANILNQVLEYLKTPIEQMTEEQVSICILSNLNDKKLTKASVTLHHVPEALGHKLEEASLFAELDPYRAATHNKGVMNGIDSVLIATGNDWRAVEAGIHAYAARDGQYRAITRWRYQEGTLTGELVAPIIVGTVGGVTALHPTAKQCLTMLNVKSANHLSRIIAAVGLVQNLGAIKALCTDGIIQGHMKLHIDNLAMSAGATIHEIPLLKEKLTLSLETDRRISFHLTQQLLAEIRQGERVV